MDKLKFRELERMHLSRVASFTCDPSIHERLLELELEIQRLKLSTFKFLTKNNKV